MTLSLHDLLDLMRRPASEVKAEVAALNLADLEATLPAALSQVDTPKDLHWDEARTA